MAANRPFRARSRRTTTSRLLRGKPLRLSPARQHPEGTGIAAGAISRIGQRVVELYMIPDLRTYSINAKAREPLVRFMTGALEGAGCKIIHSTPLERAPFVIAFETPTGERMGIVAYAFLATRTPT